MDKHKDVYVFTDNQSAIQAVETPKRQSGQYIVEKILDTIDKIHKLAPYTGYQGIKTSRATNRRTNSKGSSYPKCYSTERNDEISSK
jgi:hypothetical protein